MPRWDLVYKWADPETRSLVDAVTSALENCDHKLTAALATPPPVPAAPHPVLAKYGLESMAGDPLEVLDRHLSNNASASIGGWKAVAERWRKRALAAEAGAVPAAPGLDDPLDVNGPGRCSECGHAVRLVHRFPGGVEPEGYEPHPALARPPYPTPPEFAAMTPEQFSAFLDRIGHKPSLPEETN